MGSDRGVGLRALGDIEISTVARMEQSGLYLPLADSWQLFDNSARSAPRPIAAGKGQTVRVTDDPEAWRNLTESYRG